MQPVDDPTIVDDVFFKRRLQSARPRTSHVKMRRETQERLDRFVGNLLDMTRLDAGAIAPKREAVDAGDLVSTGPNLHPYFEVLAVNGDKAWVRNVQNGADHLALVNRCRRLGGALDGLAMAAE